MSYLSLWSLYGVKAFPGKQKIFQQTIGQMARSYEVTLRLNENAVA